MNPQKILTDDPELLPFKAIIEGRHQRFSNKYKLYVEKAGSLADFANGYLYYGLHQENGQWVFREWAPNASKIFIVGDFSNWEIDPKYSLEPIGNGNWEIYLPLNCLKHGDFYKLNVAWGNGQGYRIPSYADRVVQDDNTKIFSAQVWHPQQEYVWKYQQPQANAAPFIYEAHIGMSSEEEKVAGYDEFRKNVLPRIIKGGYNTLQLMAVQEHPYYGSFGYHVSNFFAASSRFGTPEQLKQLIDEAHGAGLRVIMDIIHSHAVKNESEGLSRFDGTYYQYFHDLPRGNHNAWDSRCFDYGKEQVIHFLLSNCKYWLTEYKFDGFRFDGVTSMLYYDHGLSRDFTSYSQYYDQQQDEDAITYLLLANQLIHEISGSAITIAEEMSGMPGLSLAIDSGGFGFDYRLAMGVPDYWIKTIKEKKDEEWDVGNIFFECTNQRMNEKSITYVESHDQALVGDKTISFRLMDKEMYFAMDKNLENLIIDRGISLHKLIRLFTLTTGGSGYLNFMGNEFGHPEWIDFPSEHNAWSYKYARRQWSLLEDKNLKYHYLGDFDREMIHLSRKINIYEKDIEYYRYFPDKMIVYFIRSKHLFVFNFNPEISFTDFGIDIMEGTYRIVLNSDEPEYGGFGRIDSKMPYKTITLNNTNTSQLWLYLPTRTGLVLESLI